MESKQLPLPPKIDIGLPYIGPAIPFLRDMMGTYDKMHARYGKTFRTQFFGVPQIFLLGPEAIELILQDREGNFSAREGWSLFLDHVFPGAILAQDGAEHLRLRRIMQGAFGRDAMTGYLEGMHPAIGRGLNDLGEKAKSDNFRVFPFIKQLTLDIATSTFAGMENGRDTDRLNRAFVDCVEASLAVVRLPIPGTKYLRGLRGRKKLEKAYTSVLVEKRAHVTPDLFSRLCHAKSEDGAAFSDREVIDQMIFVMMAAHDTSTSTLTTMIYLLAKHPEWQERLRERALAYDADELRYEDLDAQEELTWVVKEALRLYPPLTSMPRTTVREITWDGYRIPKGSLVGAFPFFNHRLPELWSNPKAFDPERFAPSRREDKHHRYAWTPFGSGIHTCIGQHFGMMEIRAIMHRLLRMYRWTVPTGYEMPVQLVPIVKPKDGLPVRVERLKVTDYHGL